MAKFYYLEMHNKEDLEKGLNCIKKWEGKWQDKTFGKVCTIYAKKHQSVESRELNRFRRGFYQVFEEALAKSVKYAPGQTAFRLHTASGTMFMESEGDDLELVSFPRELLRESSSLDLHYNSWSKLGFTKEQVDNMVEEAIKKSSPKK